MPEAYGEVIRVLGLQENTNAVFFLVPCAGINPNFGFT